MAKPRHCATIATLEVPVDLNDRGVTVFCGSSPGHDPRFVQAARDLGTALAQAGARVVYGGASVGTMGAVADAALEAGGQVLGVIPQQLFDREVAHRGLTELLVVTSMHARKAVMSERCDAYVVLPGGYGTWDELFEVVTWKQLGLHVKPIVLVDLDGYYAPLLAQIEHSIAAGFLRPAFRDYIAVARTVPEVMTLLRSYAPPSGGIGKWA
jgi:uncharacterized protein (TIGR00730 family)